MLLIEKILIQIEATIAPSVIQHAKAMLFREDVLMFRLSDGFFMTRVKDEQGQIFTAHSHLRNWPDKNQKCLCAKSMPCVHLLAGLYAWLDKNTETKAQAETSQYQYTWHKQSEIPEVDTSWQSEIEGSVLEGFALNLSLKQADETWNVVDILVNLLQTHDFTSLMNKDDHLVFQVVNPQGKVLNVAWWRLKWFLTRLIDADKRLGSNSMRLANWDAIEELQAQAKVLSNTHNQWLGGESWKKMLWLLDNQTCFPLPSSLNCELRPYQIDGVNWFRRLQQAGFGGILADDMGLGKTVQTLTYLLGVKEQGLLDKPALIVVPTSLLGNWQEEAKAYTPELKLTVFHGRLRSKTNLQGMDLVVTSYGMVQRHRQFFWDTMFSHIVLDEAQLIKNFQSQKTQVLKKCQAPIRFCLSGTPMENHLGELWSLMDFAVPELLGSRQHFRKNIQHAIEQDNRIDVKDKLLAKVHPFLLRRSKIEVLASLPPKTKIIEKISMQDEQLSLYETVRAMLAEKVQFALAEKGLLQSRWVVLDALLKLRQICCDPRLLPESWQGGVGDNSSAKLTHLMDMLDNLIQEGRSVLVFSQFTKMLAIIEQELQKRSYPYLILTGKTQRRDELVKKFQETDVPIFLLSLKAGGLGLNLTKADTVIHYEPWWNPAVAAQATDRIHRIGQEQAVFEYHLLVEGSIEEKMHALQAKKKDLFDNMIETVGKTNFQWSEEDIMAFFA